MTNDYFSSGDPGLVNAIELADRWWVLAIRGVAAIVFGVLSFVRPGMSLVVLVAFVGAYAFVDGFVSLVHAFRGRRAGRPWGSLVFEGIVAIGAGVITFMWPKITALTLLFLIGGWAIVRGVVEIAAAIRLRKQIKGEWALGLAGVLSVAFGVLVIAAPGAGALAMVLWIGFYAVIFGALMLAAAFKLRAWKHGGGRSMPSGGVPTPI